jgi:hypothetical protein
LLIIGCNKVPEGILDQKQMENVIYDTHMAESIMEEYTLNVKSKDDKMRVLANIYKKNNTTKAQFDSSLVYYSAHLTDLMKIYERVEKRIDNEVLTISKEVNAYDLSLLTPEGDSVDIWKGSPEFILDPRLLTQNRYYHINCDTNFKNGDSLVLNMNICKMVPDSISRIYLLFAISANNDSISMVDTFIVDNGYIKLSLNYPDAKPVGSVITNITYLSDNDSILSPVYINDVSLMRFHRDMTLKTDSLPTEIKSDE